MRIVAIESGSADLSALLSALRQVYPDAEVACFTDPMLAIKECWERPADLAAAGYDLKRMDGLMTLKLLRRMKPSLQAVLVDDGEERRGEAIRLKMGYLSRPVTVESLRKNIGGLQ